MKCLDLNSDLGEGIGLDDQIIPLITSANIACGFHAGDGLTMDQTIRLAKQAGTACGAHPGYPDQVDFGRQVMTLRPEEARSYIIYQLGALTGFAKASHIRLQHVKLHGAFYNQACHEESLAQAVIDSLKAFDDELILVGLSGSLLLTMAKDQGLRVAHEVFADRAYLDDGRLAPRSLPGSVLTDRAAALKQVQQLVQAGLVTSLSGKPIPIQADTICVHGDNLQALAFIQDIRQVIEQSGITLARLDRFID